MADDAAAPGATPAERGPHSAAETLRPQTRPKPPAPEPEPLERDPDFLASLERIRAPWERWCGRGFLALAVIATVAATVARSFPTGLSPDQPFYLALLLLGFVAVMGPAVLVAPRWALERARGTMESWILTPAPPEPLFRATVRVMFAPLERVLVAGAILPSLAFLVFVGAGKDLLLFVFCAGLVTQLGYLSAAAAARASTILRSVPGTVVVSTGIFLFHTMLSWIAGMTIGCTLAFLAVYFLGLGPLGRFGAGWDWVFLAGLFGVSVSLRYAARENLEKAAFTFGRNVLDVDLEAPPPPPGFRMPYPPGYYIPPGLKQEP